MTAKHKPTEKFRQQVETMRACGIPGEDIAAVIGISKPTLLKYYRAELDTAEIKANARVGQSLFRKAIGDGPASVTAAIFWMKTRARWTEAREVETLNVNIGIDPDDYSDADLIAVIERGRSRRKAAEKAAGSGEADSVH